MFRSRHLVAVSCGALLMAATYARAAEELSVTLSNTYNGDFDGTYTVSSFAPGSSATGSGDNGGTLTLGLVSPGQYQAIIDLPSGESAQPNANFLFDGTAGQLQSALNSSGYFEDISPGGDDNGSFDATAVVSVPEPNVVAGLLALVPLIARPRCKRQRWFFVR